MQNGISAGVWRWDGEKGEEMKKLVVREGRMNECVGKGWLTEVDI